MIRHVDILFKTHAVDAAKIADSYVSAKEAEAINWIGSKIEAAYNNGQYKTDPLVIVNLTQTILDYFIDDLGYKVEDNAIDDRFFESHKDALAQYKVDSSDLDRYNLITLHFENEFAPPITSGHIYSPDCYICESNLDKTCANSNVQSENCRHCILSKYNTGVD